MLHFAQDLFGLLKKDEALQWKLTSVCLFFMCALYFILVWSMVRRGIPDKERINPFRNALLSLLIYSRNLIIFTPDSPFQNAIRLYFVTKLDLKVAAKQRCLMKRLDSHSGILNSQINKIVEVTPKLAYKDNLFL